MKSGYYFTIILLLVATLLKAIKIPASALLLQNSSPFMLTGLVSIGGLLFGLCTMIANRKSAMNNEIRKFKKKDFSILAILLLSVLLSSILFNYGLSLSNASSVSLIKSLTLVATAVIAMIFLKEMISKRLWIAIMLITLGCITIGSGKIEDLIASPGLILIFISCILGGVTYCSQKKLAHRDIGTLILIQSLFVFATSISLGFVCGESLPDIKTILFTVILGVLIHGVVSFLYIRSARTFGISRCSAIITISPILGAGISLIIFQESPSIAFVISLILLIPGFAMVIWDKEEKARIDGIKNLSAEAIEEIEKKKPKRYHDIRNYLTTIGFLVIFAFFFMMSFTNFVNILKINASILEFSTLLTFSVLLTLIGIILIILRKRDLAGMSFLMTGFIIGLIILSNDNPGVFYTVGIISIIFGLILLTAKEKKRFCFSILSIALGADLLLFGLLGSSIVLLILCIIINLYAGIIAILATGLLPNFKITHILCETERLDFSVTGSMLNYVLFATFALTTLAHYVLGKEIIPYDTVAIISLFCGIMIGITSIILIFIAKNKFSSCIFLGISVYLLLFSLSVGTTYYIIGIFMFILGMICLLRRTESYLILAVMCILCGIFILSINHLYADASVPLYSIIMIAGIFTIAIYLAVASFSRRLKLPLF